MFLYSIPVFLGSALLFAVQPMLGRALLPAFGGSSHIWTLCLVSYQLLLLAGSVYADCVASMRRREKVHVAVLAVSLAWLLAVALRGGAPWIPAAGTIPESVAAILAVIVAIGLPYVALGANSSLLQKLAADGGVGREAYRLYAVSNAGSFVGLLAYPLLVEPYLDVSLQWVLFTILFAVLLAFWLFASRMDGAGSRRLREPANGAAQADAPHSPNILSPSTRPGMWGRLGVAALPALSTALLNAVTTHLSTDVSPIPLMWAILLAAFLLSYTVGFTRLGEKLLPLWLVLAALSAWKASSLLTNASGRAVFVSNFAAGCAVILFGGLFLHSWLCRLRPGPEHLTAYYLLIALGGAAGGLLSGVVPVFVFKTAAEYPLSLFLLACAVAAAVATVLSDGLRRLYAILFPRSPRPSAAISAAAVLAVPLCVGASLVRTSSSPYSKIYGRGRNFYGCWAVVRDTVVLDDGTQTGYDRPRYETTVLLNGTTAHGVEAEAEGFRNRPTAYYGPLGGGLAFTLHQKYAETNAPMSVGIVGMGAGTQAWYGRGGDRVVFYEIDPAVVAAARDHFGFLSGSAAEVQVVPGDARKALEREVAEGARPYDVLVIDAYSGDSIPYHLVTREAFALYGLRLAPGGILALHITNWHVDLLPICKAAAAQLGKKALGVESRGGVFTWDSQWVFLSDDQLEAPEGCVVQDWSKVRDVAMPRDGCGSLLPFTTLRRRSPVAQ